MIDAFATERQFLAHLAPVWHALDPAERGTFWAAGGLGDLPASEGIETRVGYPARGLEPPVLVASWQDHHSASARGRPTVYLEHGAGQTYRTPEQDPHPSYSGSPGHEGTVLFLSPSEEVAGRWRARYPDVPAVAVGCPKLDRFHADRFALDVGRSLRRPLCSCHPLPTDRLPDPLTSAAHARAVEMAHGTVAISFHSAVRLCPETYSAFPHYSAGLKAAVARLRATGLEVLGHGHPRLWARIEPVWRACGVEPVEDFAEVLARASVYACDNSSTLPEAASCGLRLVWLEAPWFRRDADHGGRFWDWPAGQVSCAGPEDLPDAVLEALSDPPGAREAREAMVAAVYLATDGRASERAAAAIRAIA